MEIRPSVVEREPLVAAIAARLSKVAQRHPSRATALSIVSESVLQTHHRFCPGHSVNVGWRLKDGIVRIIQQIP